MRDRIRPPKELEDVLDKLKDDKVFDTKQKEMMFADAVGYSLHRDKVDTTELDTVGEAIKMEYFEKPDDVGFIDALAVTKRNDLGVVSDERQPERVELFEKYAILGLEELKRACYDEKPEYPLYGVFELIDRMDRPEGGDLPGLEGLI